MSPPFFESLYRNVEAFFINRNSLSIL